MLYSGAYFSRQMPGSRAGSRYRSLGRRRAEEGSPDEVRRLALHRRRDVAVEVGEQRGVGVTEALRGDLGRHAACKHQRRAGVPQAMGGEPRETKLRAVLPEHTRQVLRVVPAALEAGEDVVAVDVRRRRQPLLGLDLALLL